MEATYIPRRSSTGRSNIIENCITALRETIKNNKVDLEDLSVMVINNTMPAELRSTAWKIFLGILPHDKDVYEWVQIIQDGRLNFEKLSSDKELEDYVKVIRNEAEITSLTQGPLLDDYQLVAGELLKISANYDFFKSQIVAETLLRLYIIWKKQNADVTNTLEVFYILAGVIYSLYPSIIHFSTNAKEINSKEDADPKTLFYFLNDEEYFDSDVYLVFDFLMNKKELKTLIAESAKLTRNSWETITQVIVDKDNLFPLAGETKNLASTFNRFEKISYLYLKVANPKLLSHLLAIKLDPYEIVQHWYTSLFTSSICFEHLTYFWDNIFLRSNEDQEINVTLSFSDYISVSLINNLANELLTADLVSAKKILMKYPEHSLNLKDIVKRALKLKEKINDELSA